MSKAGKDLRLCMVIKKDGLSNTGARKSMIKPARQLSCSVEVFPSISNMISVKRNPRVCRKLTYHCSSQTQFCTFIFPHGIKPAEFDDPLTFHLSPPRGWHFCLLANISTTNGWIAMTFGARSYSTGMICINFHPLTFHLAPSSGQHFNLSNI